MYDINTVDSVLILSRLKSMHPDAGCELNYSTPFQLLVAVILSAQCTDKRVNEVTSELFKTFSTPQEFASLTLEELRPYIFSCGFFNNKGKNIIETAKIISTKYHGEVPRTIEELTALPGVGRKTASVVLTVAYDIPAMPVDTHVYRVARRLGLSDGNTPEKVEEDLMRAYDREDWNALHHSMIFHGRYICHSRHPECNRCTLSGVCKEKKCTE